MLDGNLSAADCFDIDDMDNFCRMIRPEGYQPVVVQDNLGSPALSIRLLVIASSKRRGRKLRKERLQSPSVDRLQERRHAAAVQSVVVSQAAH